MQIQSAPSENEQKQVASENVAQAQKLRRQIRVLNLGLALVGAIIYILYLTKGASVYSHIPGGRKFLLPIAILVFLVLAATRTYKSMGRTRIRQMPSLVSQKAWVREWTPVTLIFLVAFGLRLWGINFGLPNLEQVDEWAVADRALHIIQTGNFDPLDYHNPALPDNDRQAFTYPTLYTYMETGVFAVRFLQGVSANRYDAVSNITLPQFKPDFYLWGRALTALLGALSVLLVYGIGKKFYNRKVGLLSALFLSFFYLQAVNSHWITTDIPSSFFALLPFLFIWPILAGRDNWKLYIIAGFLAGLAVATKYNNALILLPLILAHFLGREPRRWLNWNLPFSFVAALGGFFVGVPFAFFHIPNFLTDVAEIINHYQNLGHAGYQGNQNWLYYLQAISYENIVILALGLLGVLFACVRHQKRDVVLLSFPLLSYLQLSSYKVNFTRNLMPIIPFLTIFGALGAVLIVEEALRWANKRRQLPRNWAKLALGGVALLAVSGPAFSIVQFDAYNAKPTTRALALVWAEQNLPRGAKIWLEPGSLELLPTDQYQISGGDSVLAHPFDWYAANNYNYVVLSESIYKDLYLKGDAGYKKLLDGPLPAGFSQLKIFRHDDANQPGPTLIIFSTGLPVEASSLKAFQVPKPLQINLGSAIKLVGLDLPSQAPTGSILPIAFYWQAAATPSTNYTVFVHLLNAKGQIAAQLDLQPLGNTRPTTTWKANQILRDAYMLPLPANLAPGSYQLHIGLYDASSGARLTTPDNQNEIDLGSVQITGGK